MPIILDEVIDDRRPIRPIRLTGSHYVGHYLFGMFRKVGVIRPRGGGFRRNEGERCDPIGIIEGRELADPTPNREAHEMSAADVEGVEQSHSIGDQVAQSVRRCTRLVAHGPARVAQVISDDEPGAVSETFTKLLLPREHRVAHEEYRGSARSPKVWTHRSTPLYVRSSRRTPRAGRCRCSS